MSDSVTLLTAGLDLIGEQVEATSDDGWSAASPCERWTALDVLAHVTGTTQKAIACMSGAEYTGEPADPVTGEGVAPIVQRWRDTADQAADSVIAADPAQQVETPRGSMPLGAALALPAADLAVHAWDLAAAGGRRLELSPELLAHVQSVIDSLPPDRLRSPGLFGPQVEAPPGAGPTETLMAFLGRRRPDAEESRPQVPQ
ncbi:TIGR03086 family metal-binding protein [Cumulibacter manganitolerans]|uniref:TIGR03086 family metal-binding protein n=1 Tax=Cumulibacter manganitolerans TaxID=1884992 RepID=UPI0018863793|nr:TIGR03086 family metal-binding protein [Cumulibacter manganitolerans]